MQNKSGSVTNIMFITSAIAFAGQSTQMHIMDTTKKPSAKKASLVPQTAWPVSGKPANKKLYVDYQGKRIFVCCEMRKSEVAKNPEKWIKKLADRGQSAMAIESK